MTFFCSNSFACILTDDTGAQINLPSPAKRIISLAPDITESLFAIGAGKNIIGVITGSDYPKAALSIQKVGSYAGLDLERIIALKPDLIITWGNNFPRQLAVLRKLHIPIYQNNPTQLSDVAHAMRNFGCLTGNQKQADKVAEEYMGKLAALRKRYQRQTPVRVFYQLSGDSLMTINRNSWINQAIELCGGKNVFADAKMTAVEVDVEAVIAANPDVIIAADEDDKWQKRWLPRRVGTVRPDLIDRPGPRLVDGVMEICRAATNRSGQFTPQKS